MAEQNEMLSAAVAAQFLANALPERTAAQWSGWLRNNRNHSKRAPYRIPTSRIGREVFYSRPELEEFIRFHEALRIGDVTPTGRVAEMLSAFGVGMGGSRTGYAWPDATVNAAMDETTNTPFVQVRIPAPRPTVYRLNPDQAVAFAKALATAAKEAMNDAAHQAGITT